MLMVVCLAFLGLSYDGILHYEFDQISLGLCFLFHGNIDLSIILIFVLMRLCLLQNLLPLMCCMTCIMFSVNTSPAVELFIFRFLCCLFFFLLFD